MDYLTALERDYRRLVEVAEGNLAAKVPTCPEWTMADLIYHVGMVYLHKVAAIQLNAQPSWPPDDLPDEPVLARLRRAYGELTAEFAARDPASPAYTMYKPDQTVGFWIRRMAQETVIHRIDAELAAGVPSRPVPDDLALDGIDELLLIFLTYGSQTWHEYFAGALSKGDGTLGVTAGPRRWLVRWDAAGVTAGVSDQPARAEVSGAPEPMLRWLWRRAEGPVTIDGDESQVSQMRELLHTATQ